MSARRLLAILIVAAAFAGVALAAERVVPRKAASAATWPAGNGSEIAERACGICHSPMLITQQAKDSTGWDKTLTLMEKWGAPLAPGDRAVLGKYLRSHFGVHNRK